MSFDLTNKVFKATLPVDLKLNDAAENPDLRITMKFQWTENRTFTGGIDAFKYAFRACCSMWRRQGEIARR